MRAHVIVAAHRDLSHSYAVGPEMPSVQKDDYLAVPGDVSSGHRSPHWLLVLRVVHWRTNQGLTDSGNDTPCIEIICQEVEKPLYLP